MRQWVQSFPYLTSFPVCQPALDQGKGAGHRLPREEMAAVTGRPVWAPPPERRNGTDGYGDQSDIGQRPGGCPQRFASRFL